MHTSVYHQEVDLESLDLLLAFGLTSFFIRH